MRILLTPLRMAAAVVVACSIGITAMAAPTLNVGSKRFTESYILGEVIKQSAQRRHRHQIFGATDSVHYGSLEIGKHQA